MPKVEKKKIESIFRRKREQFEVQIKEVQEKYPIVGLAYNLQTAIIAQILPKDYELTTLAEGYALATLDQQIAKLTVKNFATAFERYISCQIGISELSEKYGIEIPAEACDKPYNKAVRDP